MVRANYFDIVDSCVVARLKKGILVKGRINVTLTLRWVWRILEEDGGLWLHLIKAKYLQGYLLLVCVCREES